LSEELDDLTAEAMRALTERRRKVVQAELFDDEDNDDFGDLNAVQSGEIEIKVQASR
jgi:hypothetical protein